VRKVGFSIDSLAHDSDGVIVPGGLILAVYGSDIYFLLVDHDHHLPLVFVSGDTSVFGAAEQVCAHVVVRALRFRINHHFVVVNLVLYHVHQLVLHLAVLGLRQVLADLASQSLHQLRLLCVLQICLCVNASWILILWIDNSTLSRWGILENIFNRLVFVKV
jgi:hypothetical protein